MSDLVRRFCDSVHVKLASLEGRMDSLKLNVGPTWHNLQEKLDEVRHRGAAERQAVTQARADLEHWADDKKAEAKEAIDQWIEDGQTRKLVSRAETAENYAGVAIDVAQAGIDEAERMVLEAIAARLDAEAGIIAWHP